MAKIDFLEIEKKYTQPLNLERRKLSPEDPRLKSEYQLGKMCRSGMTGGDRFLKYGDFYQQVLPRYMGKQITIVEVGVLSGIGLAVLCDIFPDARIIGLDIDLSHYRNNMENLVNKGAFKHNTPQLFEFDEMIDGTEKLKEILGARRKINICIDDAIHLPECALQLYAKVRPVMSKGSTYIIEDIKGIADILRVNYQETVIGEGRIGAIVR